MSRSRVIIFICCLSAFVFYGCPSLLSPGQPRESVNSHQDQPGDSSNIDSLEVGEEMQFCWYVLSNIFIFQDRLPSDPFTLFSSPGSLYESMSDPYTAYIPPGEAENFYGGFTTKTAGIGVALDSVALGYIIEDVFKNSPGELAGLAQGDIITAVDSFGVAGITMQRLSSVTAGETGESRQLQIIRDSSSITITVVLGEYSAPTVYVDSIGPQTAVIRLKAFLEDTELDGGSAAEIRQAIIRTAWADNLILDLRGNGGGLLSQCIDIAGQFLPKASPIINVKKREFDNLTYIGYETDTTYYTLENEGLALDRKLSILVDHYTASASEVLICALRDNLSGVRVVGTYTYGKASGWYPYDTPDKGVATVTGMLITPIKGEPYNLVGIKPDISVDETQDALDVAYKEISPGLAKTRRAGPSLAWVEQLGPSKWVPGLIVD